MELDPKSHNGDGLLGPNSIMVVRICGSSGVLKNPGNSIFDRPLSSLCDQGGRGVTEDKLGMSLDDVIKTQDGLG